MAEDFEIFDVTNVILSEDKLVACLFDGRYGSIAIVSIVGPDKKGAYHLDMTEPMDAMRLYWLDKFGLMTEEDMDVELEKINKGEKRKLLNKLTQELG